MDWLQAITDSLVSQFDLDPTSVALSGDDRRAILDVARIASHTSSERINAPLLCYVLGVAAGRGVPLDRTGPAAIQFAERGQSGDSLTGC